MKIHKQNIITDMDIRLNIIDIVKAEARIDRKVVIISSIIQFIIYIILLQINVLLAKLTMPLYFIFIAIVLSNGAYEKDIDNIMYNYEDKNDILRELKQFKIDKKIKDSLCEDNSMLIKTQTRLCVVVLEKMDIIKIVEREGKIFIIAERGNSSYDLGQYSSISKAKRVLDNLLRDYKEMYFDAENDYWYMVYEMPSYE